MAECMKELISSLAAWTLDGSLAISMALAREPRVYWNTGGAYSLHAMTVHVTGVSADAALSVFAAPWTWSEVVVLVATRCGCGRT